MADIIVMSVSDLVSSEQLLHISTVLNVFRLKTGDLCGTNECDFIFVVSHFNPVSVTTT